MRYKLTMSDKKSVYQLKVTIKGIKPPIWRRLLLPSDATFWELHIAIQDSFGWEDYHLHEFYIGSAWDRNVPRICFPYQEDDWLDLLEDKKPLDETKIRISDFISLQQPKSIYIYDMGDSWEHEIVLEKVSSIDVESAYPQVIAGKRACPWEDSGGVGGYLEKIEILKNKSHEYFEEIAEWVGVNNFDKLDLESFDPDAVVFRNPATELQRVKKGFEVGS